MESSWLLVKKFWSTTEHLAVLGSYLIQLQKIRQVPILHRTYISTLANMYENADFSWWNCLVGEEMENDRGRVVILYSFRYGGEEARPGMVVLQASLHQDQQRKF